MFAISWPLEMKHCLCIPLLILLLVPQLSLGAAYKWVDERGVVHFTDDLLQVPEKFRVKAERIDLASEAQETKSAEDPAAQKKEAPPKDRLGRGEEHWRAAVEEWRKKLASAQEREASLRVRYNELTEKMNESGNSVQRTTFRNERDRVKGEMGQCKTEIEEAKLMLEKKIPEEAELFRAKPEWVKQ